MQTCIYSLRKVSKVGFLTFLRDVVNPTIGMSNLVIYLDANNLYGYAISKFFLTDRFNSNKYSSNSSTGCGSSVDL